MGGRREWGGRRQASCRSRNGARWWRGEERGGLVATLKSRREREKTKAWVLALGRKLVELGGRSEGGLKGKRIGREERRRSQIWGRVGRRAKLGQGAVRGEIPQGSNRAHLRRKFPSRHRLPFRSHDRSETPPGSESPSLLRSFLGLRQPVMDPHRHDASSSWGIREFWKRQRILGIKVVAE